MATRTAGSVARTSSSSLLSAKPPSSRSLSQAQAPSLRVEPAVIPRLRLAAAKTGDHPLIHGLLVSVFHGPTAAEFHAQLEEPGYQPADRLIVKDGDEIAAHLRLARQTIQLDGAQFPVARFMDLATAPAYRGRGLATAMLAAGQRVAAERGVLVGLTRTRVPSLFARLGWSVCGQHVFSTASPRAVLAELDADAAAESTRQASPLARQDKTSIVVRPLRRIDLRAVVRLYEQASAGQSGWPMRNEAYWEWLLARGACDRVYVASTASDSANFDELLASIVGYACVRQSRLVELIAAPGLSDVGRCLAERVCADAREQDGWIMRYDAPAADPLHDLFRRAGGQVTVNQEIGGELFMAKLLDPLAALRQLCGVFAQRTAQFKDLRLPAELGMELRSGGGRRTSGAGGIVERFRIQLSRKKVRIETGGPSKHFISLAYGDLGPLLLGDASAETMIQSGRVKSSTACARQLASALFGKANWWRPPLDDLLA